MVRVRVRSLCAWHAHVFEYGSNIMADAKGSGGVQHAQCECGADNELQAKPQTEDRCNASSKQTAWAVCICAHKYLVLTILNVTTFWKETSPTHTKTIYIRQQSNQRTRYTFLVVFYELLVCAKRSGTSWETFTTM